MKADWPHGFSLQTVDLPAGSRHHALAREWDDIASYGNRPGRRSEDVWMDLSLSVESALGDCSNLVGMSIDWSKCFDRVPQGIAFQLAERQGLHPRVLQPLRGMYRELRRRFVVAGHVEKEFVASNGVIQGRPLSVLLLNFLMNTWARSFFPQAGELTADSGGRGSLGHEVQKPMS